MVSITAGIPADSVAGPEVHVGDNGIQGLSSFFRPAMALHGLKEKGREQSQDCWAGLGAFRTRAWKKHGES